MAAAQKHYQGPADKQRVVNPKISIWDEDYINAKGFRLARLTKKFSEQFYGPYEVIGQAGPASFTVKLPRDMRRIHPVFHISQLELGYLNTIPGRFQPPPPPIKVEGELEYEIAEILDSKLDWCHRPPLLYLVRWDGYAGTADETQWLKAEELEHASELVEEYHAKYPLSWSLASGPIGPEQVVSQGFYAMKVY
jgi:hypothetical protein